MWLNKLLSIFSFLDFDNIVFLNSTEKLNISSTLTKNTSIKETIIKTNYLREMFLCFILLIINVSFVFLDLFVHKNVFDNSKAFTLMFYSRIIYTSFCVISIVSFMIFKSKKIFSQKYFMAFHYIFILLTLTWSIFLTTNAQSLHGQISAYLITLFTLSFFITCTKIERFLFIICPTLILNLVFFIMYNSNLSYVFGTIMNTTFACLMCLTISSYNEYFYHLYLANAYKLTESNSTLINIKETLEHEVEQRTSALTNAHNLLLCETINKNNAEIETLKSQVELEKKQQKIKEFEIYENFRNEFFANISHELKTPLNVIFSAQQILSKQLDNKEFKPEVYLKLIKQNCFRLIRLIGNLIDITKIDSGYLSVNLSNNDIINIIEEITLSVASFIENKDINLIFDTDLEECILACDPENIERIMLNLLSNAVKFTPVSGSINVTISDNHDSISVCVKDTGIGIPIDVQNKIFDRFVQANKSTIRDNEGSGIGLSLVKSLVEMHKGEVFLDSSLGSGTSITFTLPKVLVPVTMKEPLKITPANEHVEKISIEFSDIYL